MADWLDPLVESPRPDVDAIGDKNRMEGFGFSCLHLGPISYANCLASKPPTWLQTENSEHPVQVAIVAGCRQLLTLAEN